MVRKIILAIFEGIIGILFWITVVIMIVVLVPIIFCTGGLERLEENIKKWLKRSTI